MNKCSICEGNLHIKNTCGVCKKCQDSLNFPCIMLGKGDLINDKDCEYLVTRKSNSSFLVIPLYETGDKNCEIYHTSMSNLLIGFNISTKSIIYRDILDIMLEVSPDERKRVKL